MKLFINNALQSAHMTKMINKHLGLFLLLTLTLLFGLVVLMNTPYFQKILKMSNFLDETLKKKRQLRNYHH